MDCQTAECHQTGRLAGLYGRSKTSMPGLAEDPQTGRIKVRNESLLRQVGSTLPVGPDAACDRNCHRTRTHGSWQRPAQCHDI